jgi:hypothetical protein
MKKLILILVALAVLGCAAYTSGVAQPVDNNGKKTAASKKHSDSSKKTQAQKLALCKADCSTTGVHGMLKPYGIYRRFDDDPTTIDTKRGKEIFAECVRRCQVPMPWFYFQRLSLEVTGSWFGKPASSCLDCHAAGPNLPAR